MGFYWGTDSAWHLKEENSTLKPKRVENGDEKGKEDIFFIFVTTQKKIEPKETTEIVTVLPLNLIVLAQFGFGLFKFKPNLVKIPIKKRRCSGGVW